jgi:hypothetical protein
MRGSVSIHDNEAHVNLATYAIHRRTVFPKSSTTQQISHSNSPFGRSRLTLACSTCPALRLNAPDCIT